MKLLLTALLLTSSLATAECPVTQTYTVADTIKWLPEDTDFVEKLKKERACPRAKSLPCVIEVAKLNTRSYYVVCGEER